ncbi:MAG: thioredoxin family protein [Pseudomonadota bacterium]
MLNRRLFLAGLAAAGTTTLLSTPSHAAVDFDEATFNEKLAAGEPVLLDFKADWCSTCRRQERVIGQLRADNPAYQAVMVMFADWDQYRGSELVKRFNVPRRSTLIAFKDGVEVGRVVAGTGQAQIAALFDAMV